MILRPGLLMNLKEGGEAMPALNYLAEVDRLRAKKDLTPMILDMDERELRVALLNILHGIDIYEAIDSAKMPGRRR